MKLPGIQYGRPVQSLATVSPTAPIQAAAAEAQVAGAEAKVLSGITEDIYKRDAAAEYQTLWAEAQTKLDEAERSLTDNPYREDENGNLISRHGELMNDYAAVEKEIRQSVIEKSTNMLAQQRLSQSLSERNVESRSRMGDVASKWSDANSHMKLTQSIEQNLANGRYEDAEKSFVSGAASGVWSQAEMESIPGQIMSHQRYNQLLSGISSMKDASGYNSIRGSIGSDTVINQKQKSALNAELDQRIQDSLVTAVRSVIEKKGIKRGEEFIRAINGTDFNEIGYGSEEGKYSAISRMQSVLEDYKFGLQQGKDEAELNERIQCISNGCPADPKSSVDKKALEAVFDGATEGEEPFSPKYMQTAKGMAITQGWVPPKVKSNIRAYMWHGNPQSVVDSASALLELDSVSPRSVTEFDRNDIAFALTVMDYSQFGVPPEETIAKVREGFQRVPDSLKEGRKNYFRTQLKKDTEKKLKDLVNDDSDANPWFKLSADFPQDMRMEFSSVYEDEYVRTGNEKIAAQAAYRIVRNIWAATDRYGKLKFERNSPEAVIGGGKPVPWVTEQYKDDMKSIGKNPDNMRLEYDISKPEEHQWILFDSETNDVVVNKNGTIVTWKPDYNSSKEADRQKKKADKARKEAERQMELQRKLEEARKLHSTGRLGRREFAGLNARETDAAIATSIAEGAVSAWEFILGDIPGWKEDWNTPYGGKNADNQ